MTVTPTRTAVPARAPRTPRQGRLCLGCDPVLVALGCDAALTALADQLTDPFPLCRTCRRTGVVYLLHFTTPYKHARHYIGWTLDLPARLVKHENGTGARLLQVIGAAGIEWRLARIWPGTRRRERALKNQGGASRSCPLCGVHPRPVSRPQSATRTPGRSATAGSAVL